MRELLYSFSSDLKWFQPIIQHRKVFFFGGGGVSLTRVSGSCYITTFKKAIFNCSPRDACRSKRYFNPLSAKNVNGITRIIKPIIRVNERAHPSSSSEITQPSSGIQVSEGNIFYSAIARPVLIFLLTVKNGVCIKCIPELMALLVLFR